MEPKPLLSVPGTGMYRGIRTLVLEKAEYYRSLARKMVEQAQRTRDAEAKSGLLQLATSWNDLADKVEAIGRGERPKD